MKTRKLAVVVFLATFQLYASDSVRNWAEAESLLQERTNYHGRCEVTISPSGSRIARAQPFIETEAIVRDRHAWFIKLASTRMPTNDVERYDPWISKQTEGLWWASSSQVAPAFSNAWFAVADLRRHIHHIRPTHEFTPEYCEATFFRDRNMIKQEQAKLSGDNSKDAEKRRSLLMNRWFKANAEGRLRMKRAFAFQGSINAAESRLMDILMNQFVKKGVSQLDGDRQLAVLDELSRRAGFNTEERKEAEALLRASNSSSRPKEH